MTYDPHAPGADPTIPINTPTPVNGAVHLEPYDPTWPSMFEQEASHIRAALGDQAIVLEHIGSTSVPGLMAKPCIDICLAVPDSSDESGYVPHLEQAGFVLRIREPEWHEHRVFKSSRVNANLHVWTAGDDIVETHLAFPRWLRHNAIDRDRYASAKRRLAGQQWSTIQDYANAKDQIVTQIHTSMAQGTTWRLLGPIVRLNIQRDAIKTPDVKYERYTPEHNLLSVNALHLTHDGVFGTTEQGDAIVDVHNRTHPHSRFRGDNGVSIGFTGHYALMRERFGEHVIDGIAGESLVIDHDGRVTLDDLAGGIVILGDDGREIAVDGWSVAKPCSPFTRFCLKYGPEDRTDRRVTEGLQFLDNGTRGFNAIYEPGQAQAAEIHVGDRVYVRNI